MEVIQGECELCKGIREGILVLKNTPMLTNELNDRLKSYELAYNLGCEDIKEFCKKKYNVIWN